MHARLPLIYVLVLLVLLLLLLLLLQYQQRCLEGKVRPLQCSSTPRHSGTLQSRSRRATT
jgi:hypothetical protein